MDGGGEGADRSGEPRGEREHIGGGAPSRRGPRIADGLATPAIEQWKSPGAAAKLCRGKDRVKRYPALFDGTGCRGDGIAGGDRPRMD
jgi:hypothetical protein